MSEPGQPDWRALSVTISARYVAFLGSATGPLGPVFSSNWPGKGLGHVFPPASNYDGIVAGVEVVSGQVTDVGLRRVCFID